MLIYLFLWRKRQLIDVKGIDVFPLTFLRWSTVKKAKRDAGPKHGTENSVIHIDRSENPSST
jgi:hypothetical protein